MVVLTGLIFYVECRVTDRVEMDPSFLDELIFKRLEAASYSVEEGGLVLVSALPQTSHENFNHHLNPLNHSLLLYKMRR